MFSTFKRFFLGIEGDMSSKRLFTFILVMLFVIYFFANLFYGKVLKDSLEEYLFYLIIIFFFGVASEKWAPKKSVKITEGSQTMTATSLNQSATVTKDEVTP